jgi:hypothetical protein
LLTHAQELQLSYARTGFKLGNPVLGCPHRSKRVTDFIQCNIAAQDLRLNDPKKYHPKPEPANIPDLNASGFTAEYLAGVWVTLYTTESGTEAHEYPYGCSVYDVECVYHKDTCGVYFNTDKLGRNEPLSSPMCVELPTAYDLTVMVSADRYPHSYMKDNQLVGFDLALILAVCQAAGISCAIMTAPWQSAWPANFSQFGIANNSNYHTYGYPGEGFQAKWYDCVAGIDASKLAQQSLLFTHTYTNGPIRSSAQAPPGDMAVGAAFACRSDNPEAVRLLNKVTSPSRMRTVVGMHIL